MSQIFESLRMRVENENESSHKKIESWDWEWDESFPWESQFRDRDESLAEVWGLKTKEKQTLFEEMNVIKIFYIQPCEDRILRKGFFWKWHGWMVDERLETNDTRRIQSSAINKSPSHKWCIRSGWCILKSSPFYVISKAIIT